ncbi:MAG TPA: zinc-ribbon domain-containing protein [Verrucomicrobiae bacterium]|nr:zinc-ribbon domain-containing protein [Verrucomicrobiae bacterium]
MFCDRCGTSLADTARFCSTCGKSFVPAPQVRMPGPRVAGHIRTLGILWIVYSVIHLIPGLIVGSMPHWLPFNSDFPFFMGGLFRFIGGVLMVKGILGVIAGWGLLDRQSWARLLAIVIAFLSLFQFPFGTAIGIYTLWVLLPGASEMEYRQMARG